jgi:anthranilate synthase
MQTHYETKGGVAVARRVEELAYPADVAAAARALDGVRGLLLASSCDVPGRYARYDLAVVDPPLALTGRGRALEVEALSARGRVLLSAVAGALARCPEASRLEVDEGAGRVRSVARPPEGSFTEEERSRLPSLFSLLRAVIACFASEDDDRLGLYGAFGYDLAFQLEPIPLRLPRAADQRDLVLYLPDEILVVDHRKERAELRRYEFACAGRTTEGLARPPARVARGGEACARPAPAAARPAPRSDHAPGEYAALVDRARERFRSGDLFEVVPSQTFFAPCAAPPSEVFLRLARRNPAPYGFLANLGEGELLIGASPEMYVRVTGRRVETCPIAGTIARGADPLADAEQVRRLLASEKDESELTMCTDVDRNDKSRVCEPGSVRVLARREVELYSRLIHTVDHVEGRLREGCDALDAFLSHAWAVTVTGAPKRAAMDFIEASERSPRRWYGGAVGALGFDGSANTGLTLRTMRVSEGVAEVRAGATLLFESDPEAEERETELKAAALLEALVPDRDAAAAEETATPRGFADPAAAGAPSRQAAPPAGAGRRVLLVDCQDSFVHTLGDYFRSTGAKVKTLRVGFPLEELRRQEPDLVVLSPGPGRPADFGLSRVIEAALARDLPVFGVCLGLQAIAEHFGGELALLPAPRHGKRTRVRVLGGRLFEGLPRELEAGRYHSLVARRETLPPELAVTAVAEDGAVMALEHEALPVAAVQFHPESILTQAGGVGLALVERAVALVPARPGAKRGRVLGA